MLNSRDHSAARGSVVRIAGTGYGPLDSDGQAAVEVWIGSYPAQVFFSGPAPGEPGRWRIDAGVPEQSGPSGQTPLFVKAHGRLSNGVTIWLE